MLKLAKKNTTPPGGYFYVDPNSKQRITAPHMQGLVAKVIIHRKSNKFEIADNLSDVIEDWLCRHLPPGLCRDNSGRISTRGIHYRTAENAVRNSSLLSRIMRRSGRNPVNKKISDKRAAVCVACEFNLAMAGCMSCRGVKSIIDNMRYGKKTSHDKQLRVCGVCGVLNHVHVFIDDKTIRETIEKVTEYPDQCWKLAVVKKN